MAPQAGRRAADDRAARGSPPRSRSRTTSRRCCCSPTYRRRRRAAAAAPAPASVRRARARVRCLPRDSARRDAPRLLRRRAAAEQKTTRAPPASAMPPASCRVGRRGRSRDGRTRRRAARRPPRRGAATVAPGACPLSAWHVYNVAGGAACGHAATRRMAARARIEQEAARRRAIPRAPWPRTCRISARRGRRRLRRRSRRRQRRAPPVRAHRQPQQQPRRQPRRRRRRRRRSARARASSAPRPEPPTADFCRRRHRRRRRGHRARGGRRRLDRRCRGWPREDGGDDLEPSAPLVPAETPGVDRTIAGRRPASYTQRLNRAREASQPQDAESKFGSYVGRLRRARAVERRATGRSASSRRILAAAVTAQPDRRRHRATRCRRSSAAAPSTAAERARRARAARASARRYVILETLDVFRCSVANYLELDLGLPIVDSSRANDYAASRRAARAIVSSSAPSGRERRRTSLRSQAAELEVDPRVQLARDRDVVLDQVQEALLHRVHVADGVRRAARVGKLGVAQSPCRPKPWPRARAPSAPPAASSI